MKKLLFFLVLTFVFTVSTSAARYYVQLGTEGAAEWTISISEPDVKVDLTVEAKTLQEWYLGATLAAGDEVWIAAGTYITNTASAALTVKDATSLYGGFAGTETILSQRSVGANPWDFTNATIISGENVATTSGATYTPGLKFPVATATTLVDGITIQKYTRIGSNAPGNAVTMGKYSVLQNCIIKDNVLTFTGTTANNGSGILIQNSEATDYPVVENCYIYNNKSDQSGGTTASPGGGGALVQGIALIKGCTFESNTSIGKGAGLYINYGGGRNGGVTVENCIFKYNAKTGAQSGAGAIMFETGSGSLTDYVKNCQFIENTCATVGAGGIQTFSQVKIDLQGCTFVGNTGIAAGGVNLAGNTLAPIKNCIFRDNLSTGEGGAMTITKATTTYNCLFANNKGTSAVYLNVASSMIYNCTFANNDAIGLKFGAVATCEAKNNIFWYNTTNTITGGTTPTLDYNAYNGTTGADGTNAVITLDATNTFMSPTTYTGNAGADDAKKTESEDANWRLKSGAPAINAGTDLTAGGVTDDLYGTSRPYGAAYDMGVHEWTPTTNLNNQSKNSVKVSVEDKNIMLEGLTSGQSLKVYSTMGSLVYAKNSVNNQETISLDNNGIYIICVDNYRVKLLVK